jgi:signal transduction histidine kinase
MRRFRTLRGRLTAFAVLATTVAVALLVVGFNLILDRTLRSDIDGRLRAQATAAATTIVVEPSGFTVRDTPEHTALNARIWIFEGSRPIVRSAGAPAVQRAAAALAGRSRGYADVDDPEVRLYALPLTDDGRRLGTLVSAESLTAYDRTTDFALLGTVALGAFVLAAVYLVTWLTIGRALQPVTAMTRSAADWSERDLDRRFGLASRPDELGQLAATFDALLDRLAASLRHEQRLSAELSHELRTPLARIVAEIELLQRRDRSAEARGAAYEVIERSSEQMARILETLMAAARAEATSERGRSALAPTLAALAEDWAAPLAERGVALDVDAPGTTGAVGADADVVERVIAPLLDNAGRYARSRVTIDAARHDGRIRVRVHDDGPGLAAGEEETVFQPGTRGAAANAHAGAGLGLALARRLARSAGGDVTAATDGAPGATFVIDLPA